jgi:hypothetical protein
VPRHGRSPLLIATLAVAAAGTAAGLAAAGRVGPFDALGVAVHPAAASISQAPLAAGQLYPSPTRPPSVHQIIEISDPPRVVQPISPPEAHPTPTPPPSVEATPRATAAPTPSPGSTPCPDDCQGGGGGGDN